MLAQDEPRYRISLAAALGREGRHVEAVNELRAALISGVVACPNCTKTLVLHWINSDDLKRRPPHSPMPWHGETTILMPARTWPAPCDTWAALRPLRRHTKRHWRTAQEHSSRGEPPEVGGPYARALRANRQGTLARHKSTALVTAGHARAIEDMPPHGPRWLRATARGRVSAGLAKLVWDAQRRSFNLNDRSRSVTEA